MCFNCESGLPRGRHSLSLPPGLAQQPIVKPDLAPPHGSSLGRGSGRGVSYPLARIAELARQNLLGEGHPPSGIAPRAASSWSAASAAVSA